MFKAGPHCVALWGRGNFSGNGGQVWAAVRSGGTRDSNLWFRLKANRLVLKWKRIQNIPGGEHESTA